MKNENEKRLRDDFVFVINARFTNAYPLTTNMIHGQVVRVVMTMVILEMVPRATDLSRCKKKPDRADLSVETVAPMQTFDFE